MADRRRGESRELKKDQQVRREVLGEIGSEIAQDRTAAQYRNPNRDQRRQVRMGQRQRDCGSDEQMREDASEGQRAVRPLEPAHCQCRGVPGSQQGAIGEREQRRPKNGHSGHGDPGGDHRVLWGRANRRTRRSCLLHIEDRVRASVSGWS